MLELLTFCPCGYEEIHSTCQVPSRRPSASLYTDGPGDLLLAYLTSVRPIRVRGVPVDQEGLVVEEDDYDNKLRFGGRPLEPLQGLDTSGRVIYLGSLSKVMLPTLRLGIAVLPTPMVASLGKAKYLSHWLTGVPCRGRPPSSSTTARLRRAEAEQDVEVAKRARDQGVESFPLSYHFRDQPPEAGLLFGDGAITTKDIEEGLGLLSRCL